MNKGFFLPYQRDWINDKSQIKIVEKSRRVGLTFCQAYEDVRDCVEKNVSSVWFSSADISAGKEYIEYCLKFAELFQIAAEDLGEQIVDSISVLMVRFANNTKICALSSSPKAFRSKGGKVVLDEFAFHQNADELWKAARPCITWGFPLRILSTHNGKSCLYYHFLEETKKSKLNWSLHTIDIHRAVNEGLVDKIYGRPTTEIERQAWLENERKSCGDESTWLQEYCCIPVDETTAFLTYDLIRSCEADNILMPPENITGHVYAGIDIGREKDLTVIWLLEKLGNHKYTRHVVELAKMPYREQEEIITNIFKNCKLQRACIDATGIGDNLAESLQHRFGRYRVEKVKFTQQSKEAMATDLKMQFDDRLLLIPPDENIRKDLHSIKKVITSAGNIRFDVNRSDTDGHADRFWALALANHAVDQAMPPVIKSVTSRRTYSSYRMLEGY
ncbi:MAG: terminase family protein [Pseudomonadota bacterium]